MSRRVGLDLLVARDEAEINELIKPSARLAERRQRNQLCAVGVGCLAVLGFFCGPVKNSMSAALAAGVLVSLGGAYVKLRGLSWTKAYSRELLAHEVAGRLVIVPHRLIVRALSAGKLLDIRRLPDALFDYDFATTCELVAEFNQDPTSPLIPKILMRLFRGCPPNQPKSQK